MTDGVSDQRSYSKLYIQWTFNLGRASSGMVFTYEKWKINCINYSRIRNYANTCRSVVRTQSNNYDGANFAKKSRS